MKTLILKALVLLWVLGSLTPGLKAQNTVTLFDDGDPIYDNAGNPTTDIVYHGVSQYGSNDPGSNGIYDLGGAGRPAEAATAAGKTYSGHEYLTVWGDAVRNSARDADRVAAFVRNDVALDQSKDWFIRLDLANDFVSPDYMFRFWVLGNDQQPDATLLNSGNIRDRMTFSLGLGDQLAPPELNWDGHAGRGGFGLETMTPGGLSGASLGSRLDPKPEYTQLRGRHNLVTVQWSASAQTYTWRVSNVNGTREVTVAASDLLFHPANTWFAAGTTDNGIWQASGWTIYDITYGEGQLPQELTVTLFDDGDPIYDTSGNPITDAVPPYAFNGTNGIYDLGESGRPAEAATAAGKTYSGHEYLTVWGDAARGPARDADRIAAFVRNDVGLDQSKDWFIKLEMADDFVNPDYQFRFWVLPDTQPDATLLNSGNIRDRMTFSLAVGDQLAGDTSRGGFGLETWTPAGLAGASLGPRLDPVPNVKLLRGGINTVIVQWLAASSSYLWRISNDNGMREVTVPASDLLFQPTTTWFAAGTTDNGIWQATGWTIYDITYGPGVMAAPLALIIADQPQDASVADGFGPAATFTVAATGTGTVSYQWQFNGQNLPGETGTTLTRANVAANAGNYRVMVTDSGGNSATSRVAVLTVEPLPPGLARAQDAGADGLVVLEAEHFNRKVAKGANEWNLVTSPPEFSGDGAMQALPNSGANVNINIGASQRMDYKVQFVKTGTYHVWLRGFAPSPNAGANDSVNVGLDTTLPASSDRIAGFPADAWTWSKTTMDNDANAVPLPATFDVASAGLHLVHVWIREDGFIVDKILLTLNPDFTPADLGPAESAIVRELTVTLFDDGDPIYDNVGNPITDAVPPYAYYGTNGIYDLGGSGRPAEAATAAGKTYSGHEYLTVWGTPVTGGARDADRIAAFVRNDVGLDQSKDWFIKMDLVNDFVSPDIDMRFWVLGNDQQPDATLLNSGNIRDRMTFSFGLGDQAQGDNNRGGFWIEANLTSGLGEVLGPAGSRLDPIPDRKNFRGGHNLVEVQWSAASQSYEWRISNDNGMRVVTVPAADLTLQPQTTWFAVGTTDNGIWQASGWTIYDITYGPGVLAGPSGLIITDQPQNASVMEGLGPSATFTVAATGAGTVSYKWQFNGQDIVPAETGTTLTRANVAANAGDYRVLVSDAGGNSATSRTAVLTVEPPAPGLARAQDAGADGLVVLEAEHFNRNVAAASVAHQWDLVTSPSGFSGDGAMQALPNNGLNVADGVSISPRMDYKVQFATAGTYHVWALGLAPSPNVGANDSVHVGLDGSLPASAGRIAGFTTGDVYMWSKTRTAGDVAMLTVASAGPHVLHIWMREDGFIMDKILLTLNPDYVPTGLEPESPVSAPTERTVTLFDDGDRIYDIEGNPVTDTISGLNNGVKSGIYDLGGAGRPAEAATAAGKTYSGHEYLTVWGDPKDNEYSNPLGDGDPTKNEGLGDIIFRSPARDADRITAFIRNDVVLDHSQDWFIRMDMAVDLILHRGSALRMFMLADQPQPNATLLNSGNIREHDPLWITWTFTIGFQRPGDFPSARGGMFVEAITPAGRTVPFNPVPRLDPVPNDTLLRGGHNLVEVQWLASDKTYTVRVTNPNGMGEAIIPAADLTLQPAKTWFAAGTTDNGTWQAAGWTIFDITYGPGLLPAAPPVAPTLAFARSGDQLTLSWAAAGFVLQQNDNVANAAGWTDVSNGGTSPVTVTIGGGSRFFRLIKR